jgi:AraC-like DNA-binding protein
MLPCEALTALRTTTRLPEIARRYWHSSTRARSFIGRIDADTDEATSLMRLILMRALDRAPRSSAPHATMNFRVGRVTSYLEEMFADPTIRLASAARHVDVTPSHLERLLKEHTGLTFRQQLRRIRMRHAEHLLLTTVSIKETAPLRLRVAGASAATSCARTDALIWQDLHATAKCDHSYILRAERCVSEERRSQGIGNRSFFFNRATRCPSSRSREPAMWT